MEKRRVLGGPQGKGSFTIRAVQEVALVRYLRLPFLRPADLIAHYVEKEGVVGGKNHLNGLGSAILARSTSGPAQEFGEVAGNSNGVVVVKRGYGVVDVKVFV
ncbi:hypothetical protein D3C76_1276140 [compost metagenome]